MKRTYQPSKLVRKRRHGFMKRMASTGGRIVLSRPAVEAGESLEQAVVREFEEETGVTVRVGSLLLTRHKVLAEDESDVYFAFALEYVSGEPTARPPEIAEFREVPLDEAMSATWISELSRMAIRLARNEDGGWPRSSWKGGEAPGRASEAFHPKER